MMREKSPKEARWLRGKMKETGISNWRRIAYVLFILVVGILLAACNLNVENSEPTVTPVPSLLPEPLMGSISGLVWEDVCENYDVGDIPPTGCVVSGDEVDFVGNGLLEAGEAGIGSAQVLLGVGVCPSESFATTSTDQNGRFIFTGLEAGVYCVTAKDPVRTLGVWTYPKDDEGAGVDHITITITSGDLVENVNFGRDHFVASPNPEPTIAPTSPPCVDTAEYVRDVTISDGTRLDPGESFIKTWRLRNNGSCTWTSQYAIVFVSGHSMQGVEVLSLPGQVPPGSEIDLSIAMQAPVSDGEYAGFWKLRNASGTLFGIGESGNSPFWSMIEVGPEPEPEITEWRGEYYDNTKLSGDPVLVRNDKNIDFNWSNGSPDRDIPSDDFSTRWTRTLTFEKALYRFHLVMDDGAALWIDDQFVIDEWKEGASREVTIDVEMVKGKHNLKVQYYETGGNAIIKLWWEKLGAVTFTGWRGLYWFNRSLDSKWALVRDDAEINFDWKYESPARGIPADDFSAQWIREVEFEDGAYTFYAYSDDGLRVYADGVLVIDEWHNSDGSELYSAELELSGKHELLVQYYERKQYAYVQFWWERKNEAPVVTDDEYSVNMEEDLQVDFPGVLKNDSDADGDTLSVILVTEVANGSLKLNENGSFTYTPKEDFSGEDGFEYRATDGLVDSGIAKVRINVLLVNHAPIAVEDAYSIEEDGVLTVEETGVLENDTDEDEDDLTAILRSEPMFGIVELNENGSFAYTPDEDFNGIDHFTYVSNDSNEDSNEVEVSITVDPVNDVPEAVEDGVITKREMPIDIDVLENDIGVGDTPLEILIEIEPINGAVEVVEGQIRYSPNEDFIGEDTFSYSVSDADGESSTAMVTITVTPKDIEP